MINKKIKPQKYQIKIWARFKIPKNPGQIPTIPTAQIIPELNRNSLKKLNPVMNLDKQKSKNRTIRKTLIITIRCSDRI